MWPYTRHTTSRYEVQYRGSDVYFCFCLLCSACVAVTCPTTHCVLYLMHECTWCCLCDVDWSVFQIVGNIVTRLCVYRIVRIISPWWSPLHQLWTGGELIIRTELIILYYQYATLRGWAYNTSCAYNTYYTDVCAATSIIVWHYHFTNQLGSSRNTWGFCFV